MALEIFRGFLGLFFIAGLANYVCAGTYYSAWSYQDEYYQIGMAHTELSASNQDSGFKCSSNPMEGAGGRRNAQGQVPLIVVDESKIKNT